MMDTMAKPVARAKEAIKAAAMPVSVSVIRGDLRGTDFPFGKPTTLNRLSSKCEGSSVVAVVGVQERNHTARRRGSSRYPKARL